MGSCSTQNLRNVLGHEVHEGDSIRWIMEGEGNSASYIALAIRFTLQTGYDLLFVRYDMSLFQMRAMSKEVKPLMGDGNEGDRSFAKAVVIWARKGLLYSSGPRSNHIDELIWT